MDNTPLGTEEKLTGIETLVYDLGMGVVVLLSWVYALLCHLMDKDPFPRQGRLYNSRRDFRQVGLQKPPRDWSGIIMGVALVATLILVPLLLRPHPFG